MTEIEIFLCIDEKQISFLSIPRSDIERLAVSPFQWIRYAMFAICGARGDLCTTPNGPAVAYEDTEIANENNKYYYRPSGPCAFVDHEGLNDRLTTTYETTSRSNLRANVIRRDGPACVVTGEAVGDCDVAHLIPHSKGDKYIQEVMRLRRLEDGSVRPVARIDMTENGILLRADVHRKLARGEVALIKTPNHELRPEHLKRFGRGGEREAYITLQWIKKPEKFNRQKLVNFQALQNANMDPTPDVAHGALQNVDALFEGTGVPLPSTIILDYIYGISAYKAWGSKRGDGFDQIKAYFQEHYAKITRPRHSSPDDDSDGDVTSVPDDHDDHDDIDVTSGPDDHNDHNDTDHKHHKSRKHYPSTRSGLEDTMDELNMVLMYIHGITPEMAAERNQKKIEREERVAQEASRNKVTEWRNHLDVY